MATNANECSNSEFKDELSLLPIRDLVVYPFMILPLIIGRESSMKAVDYAINHNNRLIFLASQKDIRSESPLPSEIYDIGTVAMIMRMRKLLDGRFKILVQGLSKARIVNFLDREKCSDFYNVKLLKTEDITSSTSLIQSNALIRNAKEQLEKLISLGNVMSPDILTVVEDITDPGRLADLISANLNLHLTEAQLLLETLDPIERLNKINEVLARELDIISMQAKINNVAKEEITKSQKEYFLREQIKAIKNELGDESEIELDEFEEIKRDIKNSKMSEKVEKESFKQLKKLEKMHPESSEANILRSYLDWMTCLPWNEMSEENLDLSNAREVLDHDHYNLENVKERILEYLAVKKLKGKTMKGPILCFSGPPGVGKTSLGKSIARATGREFVRISLGGVKDEAEIRGHRRTYVGAMPGRIIQALKQVKTSNPLILLDEIDKLSSDQKGDPSSALLEVLDPEQNTYFRDHYLNVDYDLSNVMFIATSNVLDNIPSPLRDRMEVISLSGYSQEEKLEISKKYIIPKQRFENGIDEEHIDFEDSAIVSVIELFTFEAGLRNLERKIGALCRKVAMKIALGNTEQTHILPETVQKLLGPPIFINDDNIVQDQCGVTTGLAWTSAGGQVLFIEATKIKGAGKLNLTGQLGDVMKESAYTALGHIKSKSRLYCIDDNVFSTHDMHIHIPAGSTPKDGPSAGITLATTIVSLLTNTMVRHDVAMTGEITLTGRVLPIGGLKEKCLAAMRRQITTIIIPWQNKKDLIDIPEEYRNKLTFVPVRKLEEVLAIAIVDWKKYQKNFKKEYKKANIQVPLSAA